MGRALPTVRAHPPGNPMVGPDAPATSPRRQGPDAIGSTHYLYSAYAKSEDLTPPPRGSTSSDTPSSPRSGRSIRGASAARSSALRRGCGMRDCKT
jgi:hypothetical protein